MRIVERADLHKVLNSHWIIENNSNNGGHLYRFLENDVGWKIMRRISSLDSLAMKTQRKMMKLMKFLEILLVFLQLYWKLFFLQSFWDLKKIF